MRRTFSKASNEGSGAVHLRAHHRCAGVSTWLCVQSLCWNECQKAGHFSVVDFALWTVGTTDAQESYRSTRLWSNVIGTWEVLTCTSCSTGPCRCILVTNYLMTWCEREWQGSLFQSVMHDHCLRMQNAVDHFTTLTCEALASQSPRGMTKQQILMASLVRQVSSRPDAED